MSFLIKRFIRLFLLPAMFMFVSVYADTGDTKQYVQLLAKDGTVTSLVASADDDGDGIDNLLEIEGYTYSVATGLQAWDGDSSKTFYVTDPLRWSTDGDPYSDFMEVSGINMPAAISAPENHPLVAARPVISIKMTDYDVIPLATITNSQGGEQSSSFTNEVSNSNTVSASVTVGASLNPFKLVSAEATASYSHTWTQTQSTTSSFGSNWNNTRSTQPDQAARLKLRIYMENLGGATALDVMPTINLSLGDKTIATFVPSQTANTLTPPGTADSRFPKNGTIVVEKDENNNDIVVTLNELRAIQRGTPLSLEVIQVSAKVVRWDENDNDWNSEIDWAGFESEIDPVSVEVRTEMGDGTNYRYQVFAGTPYWDPQYKFEDILNLIFNMEEKQDGSYIENRKYPDNWYLSSPSQQVIDEWNNAGQPGNMLGLRMYRNTKMVMMSPGTSPGPIVKLATYSSDYKRVLVSAQPNNFPILKVTAKVPVNGTMETIELTQGEDSFYSNESDLENIAEGPGTVIVENARGDVSEATIVLPAIYADAQDVKEYSGFLPDPGGLFWIYQNGDEEKPMLLYCLFFDPETHEALDTPREYLEMSGSATAWSDYAAYNDLYRFHFDKLRINPYTLKLGLTDNTFATSETIIGSGEPANYIRSDATAGRAIYTYPEQDSAFAEISLQGTPFYIDLSLNSSRNYRDESVLLDRDRKTLRVTRGNLASISNNYYGYSGITDDSLALIREVDAVQTANNPASNEKALLFNASQFNGYVDAGRSDELRVSEALTMEAWIYPTEPVDHGGAGMIINKEGEYEMFRAGDGDLRWAITNTTPGWNWQRSYYRSPEKQWQHMAVTYDGAFIKTYINGVLFNVTEGSGNVGDYYGDWDYLLIGGRQGNNVSYFKGLIDEVRIWNRARSGAEIQSTLYDTLNASYYSSADSGLIGYWRFDRVEYLGDGVYITPDLSINANDGELWGDVQLSVLPTDIRDEREQTVREFTLQQNYPNPFNPSTKIVYSLPRAADVELAIYNMMGQKVRTLAKGRSNAGSHTLQWDARNEQGATLPSGMYIYRLVVDGQPIKTQRMILLK